MAKAVEVELEDLASWLGLAAVESHAGVATPPLTVPRSQRVGSRRPREPGTGSRAAEPENRRSGIPQLAALSAGISSFARTRPRAPVVS